jgi:hypothetical protein
LHEFIIIETKRNGKYLSCILSKITSRQILSDYFSFLWISRIVLIYLKNLNLTTAEIMNMNEDEFFILCQFQIEAGLASLSAYRERFKKDI